MIKLTEQEELNIVKIQERKIEAFNQISLMVIETATLEDAAWDVMRANHKLDPNTDYRLRNKDDSTYIEEVKNDDS